ncbi:hypothetical protein D0809_04035 [Flavobacterium circumlabens]|uniref:Uncharacterized protein n=1 Tax=Flavobacterium circumlabens TaxID=2133765 RepID=A0A4Y7UIZ6_9FLAO|nr:MULTISPECIES: hypothetical protein [Flavobacterium]QSB27215.1 hypothetical protein HAV12_000295 [Flavobacterium sp. CLA17]TCN61058.1 hypothetical protein EV142_101643 [Flavobacterium circumlabens]TEB46171.1 hypothetical protein D0809_04035 [Flavobacterium circumlabens]
MTERDKNIENLIDKMMAENTLESPSIDFTSKIMTQVLAAEKSKIKAYQPLISKTTWILMGAGLAALIAYSLYSSSDTSALETSQLYLNLDKASALFSGIHFSKNILYGVLIVPFMILIQIGVLKNYFDKKYEL